MKTSISKNGSIEFFRFIFISVIVIWHFHNIVPVFQCGDFAVDFFFILAGAMLYRSFAIHPEQDSVQYTFKRVKRIFLPWVITLVPIFFIRNRDNLFNGNYSFTHIFEHILRFFHEVLFLGQHGMFHGTSNYASWFICVLIVGGGIIYSFLYFYREKAAMLAFPVFSLLALTYFYTLPPTELWAIKGCFDVQFLRGCAEIAFGASVYFFADRYQESLRKNIRVLNLIGVIAFIFLIILLFMPRRFAPYAPLCSSALVLSCLTDNSCLQKLLDKQIWFSLGGISFEMLLIHGLVKPAVSYAGIGALPPFISIPLYYGLVIISAYGLKWLNGVLQSK